MQLLWWRGLRNILRLMIRQMNCLDVNFSIKPCFVKASRFVSSALCMAIYSTIHPVLSQVTFIYTAQYNKSQGPRTADEREVVSRPARPSRVSVFTSCTQTVLEQIKPNLRSTVSPQKCKREDRLWFRMTKRARSVHSESGDLIQRWICIFLYSKSSETVCLRGCATVLIASACREDNVWIISANHPLAGLYIHRR